MERYLAVEELMRAPRRSGNRLSIWLDSAYGNVRVPVVDAEPSKEDSDAQNSVGFRGGRDAVRSREDCGWRDERSAAAVITA